MHEQQEINIEVLISQLAEIHAAAVAATVLAGDVLIAMGRDPNTVWFRIRGTVLDNAFDIENKIRAANGLQPITEPRIVFFGEDDRDAWPATIDW